MYYHVIYLKSILPNTERVTWTLIGASSKQLEEMKKDSTIEILWIEELPNFM